MTSAADPWSARRLHGQQRKLLELTRVRLRERLSLSDSEFDSVLALVRRQMVVSLRTSPKVKATLARGICSGPNERRQGRAAPQPPPTGERPNARGLGP